MAAAGQSSRKQTSSGKLEDQAANAALYVTQPQRSKPSKSNYPLDEENRLSSAGAATSLKYASPRDLPSFPSVGLSNKDSSAGAAASLANAHQKPFEHWKPDPSSTASKAAMMARDYKAAPLWHPEASKTGSRAAVTASQDGGNVNIWRPESTQDGSSAATQAMRNKDLSPQLDYGYTADGTKKAMRAATDAMSNSRKRAGSTPLVRNSYPDSSNSAANALNAATVANQQLHKAVDYERDADDGSGSIAINAGRIQNAAITNLSREMYTSSPPVAPEVEERNRQAGLRAAAVSMAKQLYDVQQRAVDQAANDIKRADGLYAANSAHGRRSSISSTSDPPYTPLPQYANLQEAAQKLATERLAKLHDEHAAYRSYYGTNSQPQSRLSIRGRARRRASSDGHTAGTDEEQSRKIRSEMSLFTDKLAQVDSKKRQGDRDALLAAAQRNVSTRMRGMDEKVFSETGKVSPALMEEWETKANARAAAESKTRMANYGKVNIGGGKYLDQSEVDAIASARVQPTLDEITDKANERRAMDEQIRLEQEERKRVAEAAAQAEKQRNQRTKEEWKRFKEEEKREEKTKKEEERLKKAEEKKSREQEKAKTKGPLIISDPIPIANTNVSEPPALDPIPKLEPISAETKITNIGKDSMQNPLEPSESRIAEATIPNIDKNEPFNLNSATSESAIESMPPNQAMSVAERVLSAPTIDVSDTAVLPSLALNSHAPGDIVLLADDTEAETTTPTPPTATGTGSTAVTQLPGELIVPPEPAVLVKTSTEQSISATHPKPITSRIEPATQTTAIGSQTSTSPKGESKVSSWLKSKLIRRSRKASENDAEKVKTGGEPVRNGEPKIHDKALAGPDDSVSNPEAPESSMREVAFAGKQDHQKENKQKENDQEADDDLYATSTRDETGHARQRSLSTLISSLSSEERNRGRAEIRREETGSSHEEFEEARDQFDERLVPPPNFGSTGRVSDSPVRDSKFQEDL